MIHTRSGERLPLELASEGTVCAIALLATLHHPNSPNLVLIDDIERGLHPVAQRQFMECIKRLLQRRPELQVVLTTHSPYVIDELEPDQVCVMTADEQGQVAAASLSEHADCKRALDVLTTGEFLASEQESWVLDPNQRRSA